MNDPWTDRLSDYLDGELSPREAEELERHLADCADCRGLLPELKAVVERARGLEPRQPPRDLWPGIAARIGVSAAGRSAGAEEEEARERGRGWLTRLAPRPEGGRRSRPRFSFSLPQLAAAAVTIMVLSGAMVWMITAGTGVGPVAVEERPAETEDAVLAGLDDRARSGGYDEAITQLETILFYGEAALDTATVRKLRESLATVDRAIDEARSALAEDPSNPYLRQYLGETMRKKADFLRQAVTLVATES